MGVPDWWGNRRYGLFVHSNLATVPAWSPIGQYSDWYQSHLGEPVADVLLHPSPMVEVLAHHRERWGHVESFDQFMPLLSFDRFDPDQWAGLAVAAGMSYTVMVTKHHDGLCWWDAPNTERTVLHHGPRRNVMAEYSEACERADLLFGTYYSLLDWGDARYRSQPYVDEVLHPQVRDLVERYGSKVLWGDGHWGRSPQYWRSEELIEGLRKVQPDLVVNDRWSTAESDVLTFEYQTPEGVLDRPWELCRGIGYSFCHNRAERAEHHMTGGEIVALLTEVVAKGGNLLLNVGPAADGTVPKLQATPLREAGHWVRAHADLINQSSPWTNWGNNEVRYLVPGTASGSEAPGRDAPVIAAIDLTGRGEFAGMSRAAGQVTEVVSADGAPLDWEQHEAGLRVRRLDRSPGGLAAVYRAEIRPRTENSVELFPPMERLPIPLDALLAEALSGQVVQLGEGMHAGPVTVPAGVTLRGLGPDRTTIDGRGETAVVLEHGARLEHLQVIGSGARVAWFPVPTVRMVGSESVALGCKIQGHVIVEADHTTVRACRLHGLVASGSAHVTVSRSRLRGMRWDVGIDITGGFGHLVESCELYHHLCAIRLTDTLEATVRGNIIEARWWGVHLAGTEASHVVANAITHTMRAVDIEAGSFAQIDGNAVADGDSGCVVQRGATGVVVSGNHWERCRIGLLAWDSAEVNHHDNAAVDLHDPEHTITIGP